MPKMFTSGSLAPVRSRHTTLSSPALGPASITQAKAPRNGGVTNEASTRLRIRPLAGTSVRAVSHASGAPTASEARPTQNASTTVFQSALSIAGLCSTAA
jgi:hypothetical protein